MIYIVKDFNENTPGQPGWVKTYYFADYFYNFLSAYIPNISHEAHSPNIDFQGKFTMVIPVTFDSPHWFYHTGISLPTGEFIDFGEPGSRWNWNRPERYLLVYSDDFLYCSLRERDSGGGFTFIWCATPQGEFVGGTNLAHNWGTTELYATDMKLYNKDNILVSYNFIRTLNFTAPPNQVAYLDMSPISSGNDSVFLSALKSCSTTALRSTVTINGNNYFALDTNTLIPIDDNL